MTFRGRPYVLSVPPMVKIEELLCNCMSLNQVNMTHGLIVSTSYIAFEIGISHAATLAYDSSTKI